MLQVLPKPFDRSLKVVVLAGSNRVSRGRRRRLEHRIQRGEREVPLIDKAFLPLRGQLVIEYVLDWLQASGLERIWVLARRDALDRIPSRHEFTPIPQRASTGVFANLSLAYSELAPEPDEPVLVVFGDHPLNTPAALRAFLLQCARLLDRADFFHGFSLREPYLDYMPWFQRTSAHMREMAGRASGINLAVPSRLHRLRVLDELYEVRKLERLDSFVGLLGRLVHWLGPKSPGALRDAGLMYLAKELEKAARGEGRAHALARSAEAWMARRVPANRLEGYAARIMQAERGVRLVPIRHGGVGIDVDFAEELAALESSWEQLMEINRRQDAQLARD